MQYRFLFCKDVNVIHFQKFYFAPHVLSSFLFVCFFKTILVLPFHLEGFLQLTSEFRLLAHNLSLRMRHQKARNCDWQNWLIGGLVTYRVAWLCSFIGFSERNPPILWLTERC